MQINYTELAEREPFLAEGMAGAAEIDLAAPFALMLMAIDRAEARVAATGSDEGMGSDTFLAELRRLVDDFRQDDDR